MPTNNLSRFRKEDYQGSPSWWDRAIFALNLIIDYIFALNVAINSLRTTVAAVPVFQHETFTYISSGTSTTDPTSNTYSFTSTLDSAPRHLLIRVTNSTNPVFTSPVWASWHMVNDTVSIDAICGLQNSTKYTVTVTIF